MPLQFPQPEPPIVHFARELDALMERYKDLLVPAEIALVLATNVTPIAAVYTRPESLDAAKDYFCTSAKLKMAKARLES